MVTQVYDAGTQWDAGSLSKGAINLWCPQEDSIAVVGEAWGRVSGGLPSCLTLFVSSLCLKVFFQSRSIFTSLCVLGSLTRLQLLLLKRSAVFLLQLSSFLIHSSCWLNCCFIYGGVDWCAGVAAPIGRKYCPQPVSCGFLLLQDKTLHLQSWSRFSLRLLHGSQIRQNRVSTWSFVLSKSQGRRPMQRLIACTNCKFLPLQMRIQEEGRSYHRQSLTICIIIILFCRIRRSIIPQLLPRSLCVR